MRMSKHVVENEEPQMMSQYGAYPLRAGLAKLYARMSMLTPTRPGIHMHARTQRKHAHTDQYVILIAFPRQQRFVKRASVLRYTYIACLVGSYMKLKFSSYFSRVYDFISCPTRHNDEERLVWGRSQYANTLIRKAGVI
jgi:hypothetical protein